MHAVEAAHHVAVHHVDHGLGHRVVHALVGEHAFLDDDVAHRLPVFDDAHLVAGFAVQRIQVFHVAHRHDAHAVGAVVGLDHHKGLLVDAVLFVFALDLGQQCVHIAGQAVHARALVKVHVAAAVKHRVNQPRVDAQQLAKALGDFFIALKMLALAPHMPARVQGRQQVLLVQVFQNAGDARRQVVVEQNRAGVKVLEAQARFAADHRLQRYAFAIGQLNDGGFFDFGVDRANPHVQPRHVEDAAQLHHIAQVKRVARVVLGDHQQVARLGADFFNRGHRGLHGQGQHFVGEVVPAAGVQIGVHRRELEARIAHIDRAIKRRRVLHPLQAKPALNRGHGVQNALLKFVDGAV